MEGKSKQKNFFIGGIVLIAIGAIFNQWTIGMWFRPIPRPISGVSNLITIWLFQITFIFIGLLSIRYGNRFNAEIFTQWYKNISAVLIALAAGFAVMNLVIYAVSTVRASMGTQNPVAQKYGNSLKNLYPNLDYEQYQELMKETWQRPYAYEAFTTFKEAQYQGQFVNVDQNGFRHVKNQSPWPPSKKNINIFIFGNSTVFNYGVPDGETMASYIQESLREMSKGKNVAVYNFGRGFYYSSQERVLYEKLLVAGYIPSAAIFIDGQEEFEPAYSGDNPQFTGDISSFFGSGSYAKILDNLPLAQWWKSYIKTKGGVNPTTSTEVVDAQASIGRYVANKKIIEATSLSFGVKPLFIWQPVSAYGYDLSYEPFTPTVQRGIPEGYTTMAEYVRGNNMSGDFLYLADIQKNEKKALYLDGIHYSGEWSKTVASKISEFLRAKLF